MIPKSQLNGLYLFRSLIKDGCEWHGDIISNKWSECLFYSANIEYSVKQTLAAYTENEDYRLENGAIYIA